MGSQRSLITQSRWSATSGRSRGSIASSAAAIAFAEAEEAKAKIQYAEREMQIKMQKACLDAEKICLDAQLDALNAEKTATAAVAKAKALAAALVHSKESNPSTTHLARNCESLVKCNECGSEWHHSALHPGPAPVSVKAFTPTAVQGGEKSGPSKEEASTNCTEVCGENLSDEKIRFLAEQGCSWIFNTPHASHMGGVWERMIGITRKILDSMMLQMQPARLTHEVLSIFMAEVTAIVNSRPLIPISTDPEDPFILTPATLLTQKTGPYPVPPGQFDDADLYKCQWKQVQSLANTFWGKWQKQYLSTLQPRKKWQNAEQNLTEGTVVLMKDGQFKRHDWPLGRITKVFPSEDGRVREVEIKVADKTGTKLFL
ncbi:hypothetical protein AOLI_G00259090 [Acnodon oligacanthus]